jgi:hypothetical protein
MFYDAISTFTQKDSECGASGSTASLRRARIRPKADFQASRTPMYQRLGIQRAFDSVMRRLMRQPRYDCLRSGIKAFQGYTEIVRRGSMESPFCRWSNLGTYCGCYGLKHENITKCSSDGLGRTVSNVAHGDHVCSCIAETTRTGSTTLLFGTVHTRGYPI